MIKKAIHDLLLTNSTIVAALETYEFTTDTSTPAIFTGDILPENVKFPAIHIQLIGGVKFGCRSKKGADFMGDVTIYSDKKTTDDIEGTAIELFRVLDQVSIQSYLGTGWEDWGLRADPPQKVHDSNDFPGYRVAYRLRSIK